MVKLSQMRRYFTGIWIASVAFAGGLAGVSSQSQYVKMTLVEGAAKMGAVCLDGSLPGYYLGSGSGSGADNWILDLEGGGWCNDLNSCLERAKTHGGSTTYKKKRGGLSGILSNMSYLNPDFYNWNRVKVLYCDGASFGGDSVFTDGTTTLHFRGKRIWDAIILDLLSKGLNVAQKVLLSGTSAGGLATFLHCDNLKHLLPSTTTLKCLSDAGLFLDIEDVSRMNTVRPIFEGVVALQAVEKNLDRRCTTSLQNPSLCFFPQYALQYIQTPYFILNAAYDAYQFNHILVPPSTDINRTWLSFFRGKMLATLEPLRGSSSGGFFINSGTRHGQSERQAAWFSPSSPRLHNRTIAEVVGDWYFDRKTAKEVECQYSSLNSFIH
ncbi:pectin acetylesterase 9-like [Aristolochia californica]|uniref:pectin acetylesterase 9-like n=1 Tax=Aristolochia californica TaxID=171875 RepID=UPI0035D8F4C8